MDLEKKLYHTAQLFELQNNIETALECYRKIVEIKPSADACYNLGIKLYENNLIEEAADNFRRTISFNPEDADAYYNLGLALYILKQYKEAVVCFKKSLDYDGPNAHTYYCLGTSFQALKKFSAALFCCRKAVAIDPQHLRAHLTSGVIYKSLGEIEKAIYHFQQTLEIEPNRTDVLFHLAELNKKRGDSDAALDCYHQIITIASNNAEAHRKIGEILHEQGFIEKAISYFEKALTIKPDPGLEVRSALALPVINDSQKSINYYRHRLEIKLEELGNRNITLTDPLKEVGATSFLLAYHGVNDKEIQQKIAAFYLKACPSLGWVAPHCQSRLPQKGKIKIGFISTFLYSHTIAYLFLGIIKKLSRDRFHVTVFRFPGKPDQISTMIDNYADEVVGLPYNLEKARKLIGDSSTHILFYLDIGMEPITYFLAFSRLAPVQCKRGHPVTSGIPNLDYFISCDEAETEFSEQHYSEKLVRLKSYGYYYYHPVIPDPIKSRIDLGLPTNKTLYVCPQTLFKFHPDYDFLFGEILRRDPDGTLVLIQGREKSWSRLLRDRFALTFPDEIARVKFLDRLNNSNFLSLCLLADALIDTPGFTGGKISLDCFAMGVPIITIPTPYMRGRLTLAQYKLMNIYDCIAEDPQDFIRLAIKLAHDKEWKNEVSNKIRERAGILFRNLSAVKELESFFIQAITEVTH